MIEKIFLVAVLSTVMVSGILGQWGSCMNEAVLGKTCLNVTNMGAELNVALQINGTLYLNDSYNPNGVPRQPGIFCLSENSLLSLLNSNSNLTPYSSFINQTITEDGKIPWQTYSICTLFKDQMTNGTSIQACPVLQAVLMCEQSSCLYKSNDAFGCFDMSL